LGNGSEGELVLAGVLAEGLAGVLAEVLAEVLAVAVMGLKEKMKND